MSKSKSPRYDITVFGHNAHTVIAEGMAVSLLKNLAAGRIITPVGEAVHKEWVEVYCEPGPSAHDPFVKHAYEGEHPVFNEAIVRWGTTHVDPEEVNGKGPIYFYMQFRGCLFKEPLGRFRKRYMDVMKSRPQFMVTDQKEVPPRKEVDPEDQPKNKRLKKGPGPGVAGTSVEEW